jgi:hypothetical protein
MDETFISKATMREGARHYGPCRLLAVVRDFCCDSMIRRARRTGSNLQPMGGDFTSLWKIDRAMSGLLR